MATNHPQTDSLFYSLAAVGAILGLGKLLQSDEKITLRRVFGHGIVSAGLGGAAGLVLVPLPDAPLPVVLAAACALVSMGTLTLTMILQRYLDKK